MIERLLAALAEGGEDGGPPSGVGAEEIADILWLATRVDAGREHLQEPTGAPPAAPEPPPGAEPVDLATQSPGEGRAGRAGARPGVQYFPAPGRDPGGPPDQADPAARAGGAAPPGAAPARRRGTPLRLPRAASLDDPLALMRALRPVGRRNIGGPGEELDEQLTVERSIERMVLTPVLRPAESRWLDVALVVDAHHSMLLWADLVEEVRGVLTRSGVFRDVRTWRLTGTGPGSTPLITQGRDSAPRNPLELADPAGRRLILVLSDTVAGGWREAPLRAVLRQWSAHNAVAVLNVLPERLWTRGAVRPVPFAVRADRPAAATRSWQRVPMARRARGGGAVIPVVGLASGSLARLVRVVSGDGRWRRLACLRLDTEPAREAAYATPEAPKPFPDPLEVVERFRASASPTAQRLAGHLAAVPLTLPVMTLVRRSLLRESEHSHLAEVALGGLFENWEGEQDAEHAQFEFLPGVREALLGSQLRGDVAAVRELVRRRVWEYMSRNRGTGRDFTAIRLTPRGGGRRELPPEAMPFAASSGPGGGLADLVVRVRFEPQRESQAVGVLLSPRLVLTVGEAAQSPRTNAVAWVRVGDQEHLCYPAWGDGAAPQVLLLVSEVDLVNPADWTEPDWAEGFAAPGEHLVVDGSTDQGEPTALTGEVLPYDGERNGELVQLSAEPEVWTLYAGSPVSRDGRLAGIVHTVLTDRMVFLTGQALREQPGFREVMATHARRRADESGVCLAVRPHLFTGPIGWSLGEAVDELLMEAMADSGVSGVVAAHEEGLHIAVLADPGALGKAGLLLSALPAALSRLRAGAGEWEVALAVAVSGGAFTVDGEGLHGPAADEALGLVRRAEITERLNGARVPGAVLPVTGVSLGDVSELGSLALEPLYADADVDLGLYADADLDQDEDADQDEGQDARPDQGQEADRGGDQDRDREPQGWICAGGAVEVGRALIDAELRIDDPVADLAVDWPRCGHASTTAGPGGCTGIRLPDRRRCLAHLTASDQEAYLGTLRPGSDVDLRGTTFAGGLLERLLAAMRDPQTGHVRMRRALFDRARLAEDWAAVGGEFEGRASFDRAVFEGQAVFDAVHFKGSASFGRTVFRRGATFDSGVFDREARFIRADFGGNAGFTEAVFAQGLDMARAEVWDRARMSRMRVRGAADLSHAVFHGRSEWRWTTFLGPASFASTVWGAELLFDQVRFEGRTSFDHATFGAPALFKGTVFAGRATFAGADFAEYGEFTNTTFADPAGLPGPWRPLLPPSGAATFRTGGPEDRPED